jgi:Flp pilus assembly protein TadD
VTALVVDPSGLAPFGPVKFGAVSTLVFVALAAVWRRPARVARAPLVAWAVFFAFVVVAAGFGLDRLYAWTGTPERHFGALAWMLCFLAFVAGQLVEPRDARVVVGGAAIAAGLVGVWGVAEVFGWQPIELVGTGDRPVGPFGSSAYLGAALALLAPVVVGVACDRAFGRNARAVAAVASAACAVAFVASGARAAWVGALVAGVALAVVLIRTCVTNRAHERDQARRFVGAGAVAVLALVGIAFATGVAARVPDVVTDRDGGARGRLDEWRVASRVVTHNVLSGVGPEGYRIAFGQYVGASYERAHGRDPLPDRAHDSLLDVAATTGVPGVLAYVVLVFVVGRFVGRALAHGSPWQRGVAVGLVAYAAQSLFLFPIAEIDPIAWLLAGIVVAHEWRAGEVRELWLPRALPIAFAVVATAAFALGALDVVADRDAKHVLVQAANGTVVADPTRAARLRPDAVRYRLAGARAFEARGTIAGLDAATGQLDDALAVSPRDPVARAEHARLALERARRTGNAADRRRARAELERLHRDDPQNAQVLLRLGVARALAGDDRGAERAWVAAEHLAPRSAAAATDLAVLYARRGDWPAAAAAAKRALARDPAASEARDVLREARSQRETG